jgi:hypothetical protein
MLRKLFTIIVLCLAVSLFGQNEQEIIKLDSHIYPLYFSILRESGVVSPSRSLPMTRAQIYKVLDSIDFNKLSETGKKAYETIYEIEKSNLSIIDDNMIFSLDISSGLEVSLPNDSGITPIRDFNHRLPLLSLPSFLGVKDVLFFYTDLSFQEEVYGTTGDKEAFRWINIPGDLGYLDGQSPFRVYGSIGGKFWNLSLGRDRLETGVGEKSHLIIGSEPQYLENLRAKLFWNAFNYEFQLLTMLPIATNSEYWGNDPKIVTEFHNPEQWFLNHRFDFRFFKGKLRFTWNEGTIIAGQPLEPKYFNPFMIFHSFYNWYKFQTPWEGLASAISGFELSYSPIPGLEIYGHSVITQFTVPFLETVTTNLLQMVLNLVQFTILYFQRAIYIPEQSGPWHLPGFM